jgi:hypothetical protein
VNAFAPIVEKLSENFWFIAWIAVMIPTRAMMPKAMIATVNPVRNLLPRTVRKANEKTSRKLMLICYPEINQKKRDMSGWFLAAGAAIFAANAATSY